MRSSRGSTKIKLSQEQLNEIARVFAMLGEPTRLAILQVLKNGPSSVSELMKALGLKQANTSKQLALLRHAGLVLRTRRGTEALYSLQDKMLPQLCESVCDMLRSKAKRQARRFDL